MALNEQLKEILCCPKCKGELEFKEDENKIICQHCRLIYAIKDDIPIMLIDEAEAF
ncbi:Trm112 family protein [bacterium]|nr:Trm112 family protein [bacterium]